MGAMLVRHEPASASAVRHELAEDLVRHGLDGDTIDDAALVASELIGNAVRHAGVDESAELDVSWTISSDAVVISVQDPSQVLPVRRNVSADAPSGRGLSIVDALSSAWGAEPTRSGKRVWARIPTHSR
jgi:anti-sigma regulatory factor (Ser/Thr protein kinase)